jgi:hypothetical protein
VQAALNTVESDGAVLRGGPLLSSAIGRRREAAQGKVHDLFRLLPQGKMSGFEDYSFLPRVVSSSSRSVGARP